SEALARWTDRTEVCRRWRRVKDDVSRDGSNVCVTALGKTNEVPHEGSWHAESDAYFVLVFTAVQPA
ncbi:hypothetical protein, partial [Lentimonas sp. CC4]